MKPPRTRSPSAPISLDAVNTEVGLYRLLSWSTPGCSEEVLRNVERSLRKGDDYIGRGLEAEDAVAACLESARDEDDEAFAAHIVSTMELLCKTRPSLFYNNISILDNILEKPVDSAVIQKSIHLIGTLGSNGDPGIHRNIVDMLRRAYTRTPGPQKSFIREEVADAFIELAIAGVRELTQVDLYGYARNSDAPTARLLTAQLLVTYRLATGTFLGLEERVTNETYIKHSRELYWSVSPEIRREVTKRIRGLEDKL